MRGLASRMVHATVSAGVLGAAFATAPAYAGDCSTPPSGVYTAFSDGLWAQKNYRFEDELPVTTKWTVETTCTSYLDCTGTVISDAGWSAALTCGAGVWKVNRDLPHWQPCADGSVWPGRQQYLFRAVPGDRFEGWDTTTGVSGACGVNKWLIISMPFRLAPQA